MGPEYYYLIENEEKTPHAIWEALQSHFAPTTRNTQLHYCLHLYKITSTDYGDDVKRFVEAINSLSKEIDEIIDAFNKGKNLACKECGKISDHKKLAILMGGLPFSYAMTKTFIESSADVDYKKALKILEDNMSTSTPMHTF